MKLRFSKLQTLNNSPIRISIDNGLTWSESKTIDKALEEGFDIGDEVDTTSIMVKSDAVSGKVTSFKDGLDFVTSNTETESTEQVLTKTVEVLEYKSDLSSGSGVSVENNTISLNLVEGDNVKLDTDEATGAIKVSCDKTLSEEDVASLDYSNVAAIDFNQWSL